MEHKIEFTFDTDELKELFVAWFLDSGGEYKFIEDLEDYEGIRVNVEFLKDKDRIDVKSLD